jgi:hypothetical protein
MEDCTRDSSIKRQVKEMGLDFSFGLMAQSTKACGGLIERMAEEG